MSEMNTQADNATQSPAHEHGHDHDAGSDGADGPRVRLTATAAGKVKEIRKDESIEDNLGLRLRVVGGGCSGFSYDLYFDQRMEMDQEFNIHGVQIFVDQMSLMYLDGTEIDYVEGLMGAGFKFNNPQVKATCGCGSSFSV
jgi:iron-sulfur cluster insertion protein